MIVADEACQTQAQHFALLEEAFAIVRSQKDHPLGNHVPVASSQGHSSLADEDLADHWAHEKTGTDCQFAIAGEIQVEIDGGS